MAEEREGVVPMISYSDGPAALDWLAIAFGFREVARWLDDDGVLAHGEMVAGRGRIMLATPSRDYDGPLKHRSHCENAATMAGVPWVFDGVMVYVDDLASHMDRAKDAGAIMLSGVESGPDGSQLYRAEDPEGHRWMFMQVGA